MVSEQVGKEKLNVFEAASSGNELEVGLTDKHHRQTRRNQAQK